MTQDNSSGHSAVLTFGGYKVSFFVPPGRPWDEQWHDMFAIEMPGEPVAYGEWREKWAKNGNDFDVEIVYFGILDARTAGDPDASRRAYSSQEITVIEDLIRKLFANVEARSRMASFSSSKAVFLGRVAFLPGWIRLHPTL